MPPEPVNSTVAGWFWHTAMFAELVAETPEFTVKRKLVVPEEPQSGWLKLVIPVI